jgi:hypothetical protein
MTYVYPATKAAILSHNPFPKCYFRLRGHSPTAPLSPLSSWWCLPPNHPQSLLQSLPFFLCVYTNCPHDALQFILACLFVWGHLGTMPFLLLLPVSDSTATAFSRPYTKKLLRPTTSILMPLRMSTRFVLLPQKEGRFGTGRPSDMMYWNYIYRIVFSSKLWNRDAYITQNLQC